MNLWNAGHVFFSPKKNVQLMEGPRGKHIDGLKESCLTGILHRWGWMPISSSVWIFFFALYRSLDVAQIISSRSIWCFVAMTHDFGKSSSFTLLIYCYYFILQDAAENKVFSKVSCVKSSRLIKYYLTCCASQFIPRAFLHRFFHHKFQMPRSPTMNSQNSHFPINTQNHHKDEACLSHSPNPPVISPSAPGLQQLPCTPCFQGCAEEAIDLEIRCFQGHGAIFPTLPDGLDGFAKEAIPNTCRLGKRSDILESSDVNIWNVRLGQCVVEIFERENTIGMAGIPRNLSLPILCGRPSNGAKEQSSS